MYNKGKLMFNNDYSGPDYNFQSNNGHDYILRMIEQLAAYLWAIVFNKRAQNYDVAVEKIEEAYNGLLYRNGNDIKNLNVAEILNNNTNENIEIIAKLLYEEADINELKNGNNNLSLEYYCKSLKLFFSLTNEIEEGKFNKNIEEILNKLDYYELDKEMIFDIYKYYFQIGIFGKAEDKLYQLLDINYTGIIEEINKFYELLLKKDDRVLDIGNLSRNEIIEAIEKLRNRSV